MRRSSIRHSNRAATTARESRQIGLKAIRRCPHRICVESKSQGVRVTDGSRHNLRWIGTRVSHFRVPLSVAGLWSFTDVETVTWDGASPRGFREIGSGHVVVAGREVDLEGLEL